jgi:hypothetical protein
VLAHMPTLPLRYVCWLVTHRAHQGLGYPQLLLPNAGTAVANKKEGVFAISPGHQLHGSAPTRLATGGPTRSDANRRESAAAAAAWPSRVLRQYVSATPPGGPRSATTVRC